MVRWFAPNWNLCLLKVESLAIRELLIHFVNVIIMIITISKYEINLMKLYLGTQKQVTMTMSQTAMCWIVINHDYVGLYYDLNCVAQLLINLNIMQLVKLILLCFEYTLSHVIGHRFNKLLSCQYGPRFPLILTWKHHSCCAVYTAAHLRWKTPILPRHKGPLLDWDLDTVEVFG